jgi:hypothetical protein
VLLQQPDEFIPEREPGMVLSLVLDIGSQSWQARLAHGEGAVSRLPFEAPWDFVALVHPFRAVGLDPPDHLRDRDVGSELYDQMYVIGHTADLQQHTLFTSKDAADVGVQSLPSPVRDQRPPILGAEDNVV